VQFPASLAGTALVIYGPQGVGKSYVGEVMRAILGAGLSAYCDDAEQLMGRFNLWVEGKLFVQVDEAFFPGDPKARGKMKSLITSPTIRVEPKGVNAYEIRNCARYLITSNEQWNTPVELGNRRYMVVKAGEERANDAEYHQSLRDEMERGGYARFLGYLMHEVTVDWDLIRRPIPTAALRDQQIASLGPEGRWFLDLLTDGELPGDERGEGIVEKDALFPSYATSRGDRRATKARLTQFLKAYGVAEFRPRIGGRQVHAYQFPPLAECRLRFAREFAAPIEWNDQEHWGADALLTGGESGDVVPITSAARRTAS
jgi:hypothetical protein